MRILFDTNVILDVLLERDPHLRPAAKLFALVDNRRIQGYICATTATTIYYIASRSFGRKRAIEEVRSLLALFDVAPVDRPVLDSALDVEFCDYEDAVVHESARMIGADAIVTRDRRDFAKAEIPALDPTELLAVIAASN